MDSKNNKISLHWYHGEDVGFKSRYLTGLIALGYLECRKLPFTESDPQSSYLVGI